MSGRVGRLVVVALAAGAGAFVGLIYAALASTSPRFLYPSSATEYYPLPHHVPKYPGGLSLRFAMAHDVIHERFARHGPAHYRERNRLTREKLAALAADDPAAFPLADDLAAGLERLGKSDEAIRVMRDKLARQQAKGLNGRDLYTTYANLGTFLIHGHFGKAVAGDPAARDRLREGLGFVRQSIAVNPEAHFGREQWQAVAVEFLLAAMDDPSVLKKFDLLGNWLDAEAGDQAPWGFTVDSGDDYGRPADHEFRSDWHVLGRLAEYARSGARADDPDRWEEIHWLRDYITKVGAERTEWKSLPIPSHRTRVPFDEPVLGVIGMWRQGGGANPHFALCLGEVMLRVGQRYIAWTAYERAARMADRFWPDPALQQFLRDHCKKRQGEIEATLPADEVARLRPRFEEELAYGERYQREYQEYEARRIAAGVPIADEHFYDEFHAGREPIASVPGPEEWFATVPPNRRTGYDVWRFWAYAVFGAGLSAAGAAGLFWLTVWRRPRPST